MSMKDFIEFLKLPPNILAAISVVTGIILFIPNKILNKLYMVDFRNNYGFIISIIFLVSTAVLTVLLITKIYSEIKANLQNKKLKETKIKYLLNAETTKIKIIREFIKDDTHTLFLPMNDGFTKELEYYGIITLAGNTQPAEFDFDGGVYLKYFLQPWVIKLINENDELKTKYKIK